MKKTKVIEWELTLDCNLRCAYCTNGRNDCLAAPIKTEIREDVLHKFISALPNDIEIFLFGGEPTLHPKFDFIIDTFNALSKNYVLQTNLTTNKDLSNVKAMQVSIHRSQLSESALKRIILKILKYTPRRVDIMYTSKEDYDLYLKYKYLIPNLYVAPISDFNTPEITHLSALREYVKMKGEGLEGLEPGNRSIEWLKQLEGECSPKGKACPYAQTYLLYAPDLSSYNCSHRINTTTCPNRHCFMMF